MILGSGMWQLHNLKRATLLEDSTIVKRPSPPPMAHLCKPVGQVVGEWEININRRGREKRKRASVGMKRFIKPKRGTSAERPRIAVLVEIWIVWLVEVQIE
jgi:hypothetical protein